MSTVFDPPSSPPPGDSPGQQGRAAETMKKAEAALSQQQSATAEFDRQVIEAVLHAHKTTEEGRRQLSDLQAEIESAARTWDLSNAAGAREFQKFLLGKLHQIIGVVELTNDDDTSKQALAAALAALYASVPGGESSEAGDDAPEPAAPQPEAFPDSDMDPYLDALPEDGPVGESPTQRGAPNAPPTPAIPGAGEGIPGGGATPFGGVPGALPLAGLPQELQRRSTPEHLDDDPLRAEMMSADEPSVDQPGEEQTDDAAATEPAPTTVRLPDGETVNAPTPQLAAVLQAAVGGTPIADAFHQQGMTIPPPGTAVAAQVDQSRVSAGDIGMFTDRHALALSNSKALLDGQIQYIGNVRGPSFLGWQHPPGLAETTTPTQAPTPTLPSASVRA